MEEEPVEAQVSVTPTVTAVKPRGSRCAPPAAAAALAALLAVSCSASLEGTLEIRTTASEVAVSSHRVELDPRGDSLELPQGAVRASLKAGGSAIEAALGAGSRIETVSEETGRAPGSLTRILVGGVEAFRGEGMVRPSVEWSVERRRELPPKVKLIPLRLKPGQSLKIDETVMYTPLPGSTLAGVETAVRIDGSDAGKLRWEPAGPALDGRVEGRVVARGD